MDDAMNLENQIAAGENALALGVMQLGALSMYACPECHGILVQRTEGSIVRFRCHTGHAYSAQTLIVALNEAVEHTLWNTLRALEETMLVAQQLAHGHPDDQQAAQLVQHAEQTRQQAILIRQALGVSTAEPPPMPHAEG